MKLMKIDQNDIQSYIQVGLQNAECVLYGIYDRTFVWLCKDKKYDKEYIESHNIEYKEIDGDGSAIVCSAGDIDLGIFGSENFCNTQFQKISELISSKITNGKLLNNDFMYGTGKYGSATKIDFGNVKYIGIHISNYVNNELIDKICKKTMFKMPSQLDNKVTEQDIIDLWGDE